MTDGRARLAAHPRDDLTPRQREVMELMAHGKTNFEIAQALGITLEGAKYHVSEILARLDVDSREQAIAAWQSGRRGWRWTRPRILVPAAAGIAAVAVGALLILALLQDDPALTGEPEAWVAWVADDLNESSPRTELHVRRGSQPETELFPETEFDVWYSPRWSPDGRVLAAVAGTEGGGASLVLFERHTSKVRSVHVDSPRVPPAWKPDSSALSLPTESGVVTFDLELNEVARSEAPPASMVSPTSLDARWSPDGDHLALLAYGNLLVMNEEGRFTVADASAAADHSDPRNLIKADDNQPYPLLLWQSNNAFHLFTFPPDLATVSSSDSIRWSVERDGSAWRLAGSEPNPLPEGLLAPGDSEPRGRLVWILADGSLQALTSGRIEGGRYDPGEPSHWAILHVVSADRVYAEFELPKVILGPGSRRTIFDLVLVSE